MTGLVNIHTPLINRSQWTSDIKKNAFLSSSALKLIALIAMLIDHIAAICLPVNSEVYLVMRLIGRVSFPIYAFLIAEGYLYTSNKGKYLSNLMLFALISEIPYNLAFSGTILSIEKQNIFFELATGLFGIYVYEKVTQNRNKLIALICVFVLAMIAEVAKFDYGALGIIIILVFYLFRSSCELKLAVFVIASIVYYCYSFGLSQLNFLNAAIILLSNLNIYMILGAFPIAYYNGKKGTLKMNKYLFYAFYPVHILVLYLISFLFVT